MKNILFSIVVLISIQSYAQKINWSAIHLKNGSVIRGVILDDNYDKLKLETYDKSIWVFDKAEVDSIASVKKFKTSDRIEVKYKGYYNISDVGLLFGNRTGYYSAPTFVSAQMINGYRFMPNLSVGIGVGAEYISNQTLLPVFGEVRYDLLKKSFTPFVTLQGGYGLPTKRGSDDYYSSYQYFGGIMMNAAVGVKKYLAQNFGIVASLGFRHQQISYSYSYSYYWDEAYNNETFTKNIYNRLAIRVGLVFN